MFGEMVLSKILGMGGVRFESISCINLSKVNSKRVKVIFPEFTDGFLKTIRVSEYRNRVGLPFWVVKEACNDEAYCFHDFMDVLRWFHKTFDHRGLGNY